MVCIPPLKKKKEYTVYIFEILRFLKRFFGRLWFGGMLWLTGFVCMLVFVVPGMKTLPPPAGHVLAVSRDIYFISICMFYCFMLYTFDKRETKWSGKLILFDKI